MFTGKLALRYIKEQKRHSVLTVCSITAAVAFVAMLFIVASSAIETMYNYNYQQTPYHTVVDISLVVDNYDEYAENFKEDFINNYGTINEIDYRDEYYPSVTYQCFFTKTLPINSGYLNDFVNELLIKAGFPYEDAYDVGGALRHHNTDLDFLKPISSGARKQWMSIFALMYLVAVVIVISLRLLIDTAFEISSKEREKQFGVLQSIGATPKQITKIITLEGVILSAVGVPLGLLTGTGIAFVIYKIFEYSEIMEAFVSAETVQQILEFSVNPWFMVIAGITGFGWVLLSAYGTGRRCIKKSPIQAISARSDKVKLPKRRSPIDKLFVKIFGWEGDLAARNNRRQPKRFIVSVVSLTVSITLYAAVSTAVTILDDFVGKNMYAGVEFEFSPAGSYVSEQDGTVHDLGIFSYKDTVKRMNESGLFKEPMTYVKTQIYQKDEVKNSNYIIYIAYVNEAMYNYMFDEVYGKQNSGGEPHMSYEEFSKSNTYIVPDGNTGYLERLGTFSENKDKFTIRIDGNYSTSSIERVKPEYRDLYEEKEVEGYGTYYIYENSEEITFNISSILDYNSDSLNNTAAIPAGANFLSYEFIGSLDAYENGEYKRIDSALEIFNYVSANSKVLCDLKNPDDYGKVSQFVEDNSDVISEYYDFFDTVRKTKALLGAINIGSNVLVIMFALVAVINMVNVLSTGIINRRGELASLQSVGMTEKQMNKMTVLECLQYVFISGIMSIILCEIIMGGTLLLFSLLGEGVVENIFGNVVWAFGIPVLKVLIAVIPAFAAALLASFIPLRALKKRSLVEQIRSID